MTKIASSPFKRLVGTWKTSGKMRSDQNTTTFKGTDSYEIILNGHYILHKADVLMGDEPSETFEMIEISGDSEKAQMTYFNSKGETGAMTSQIKGNDFLINGDGIKFVGKINDANTEVVGNWFLQSEDKTWNEYIELILEKQL